MRQLLVIILLAASLWAADLTVAGRGLTAIVVAEQPKDAEMLAAREIQRFVRQATGVELPIQSRADGAAIHVGATPALLSNGVRTDSFAADEYVVKTVPEGVLVAGRDYAGGPIIGLRHPFNRSVVWKESLKLCSFGSSGTLFAAYALLEEAFGVRFYWPGKLGTVVPVRQEVRLDGLDIRRKPAFRYRNILFATFANADEDNVLWYKQLGLGGEAPVQLNHSFRYLEDIAKANPEFYGVLKGKRHAGKGFSVSESQYCLSNPQFRQKVIEHVCKYFDEHPEHRLFPLVPGDGCHRICECPQCQAQLRPDLGVQGQFSFHIWDFINEVAKGVYARHPECSVGGLAYGRYNIVPSEVKLHPSVSVMICRQRAFTVAPAYREAQRKNILAWGAQTRNIYFWDYYLTVWRPPWQDYPIFFPDVAQEDLRFLHSQGYGGEFIESYAQRSKGQRRQVTRPGMQHLDIYITAKLYWNPDLDMNDLLREYYRLFYGSAEQEMRDFWETARRCWNENGRRQFVTREGALPQSRATAIFSAEDMGRLDRDLQEALAKLSPDSDYASRVAVIQGEFRNAQERHALQLQFKPQTLMVPSDTRKPLRWQFAQKDGRTSQFPTYADLSYDQQNLYLHLMAFDPEMDKIKTTATQEKTGGVSGDDCFEIFVNGSVEERMLTPYYQIDLNANGAQKGWKVSPGGLSLDSTWKSPCKVTAQRFANRWEAQVTLPLADLGLPDGKPGSAFLMNIYRIRVAEGPSEISSLIPTFTFLHRDPDKLCRIELQ
ncbi:MAG: DUF4838 domain-containing protein [Victivallales bacterium]|nr:DUF4838 domain-containing protein [Victivallales bacterium]